MAGVVTAISALSADVARLRANAASSGNEQTQRPQRRRDGRQGATTPSSSSSSSESSNDGGSSPSSHDSSNSDDSSESSEDVRDAHGHGRERHGRQGRRVSRRRNPSIKDLEIPTYVPSPTNAVSTWIDKVDLALQGAAESGRGSWSDRSLYFILGGKLMEEASRWYVNMNRQLPRRKQTWTYLKRALTRRYGETYADFAAGLRMAAGRNAVRERVFVAQFCRCLDKTTRQLVMQKGKPKTLERAVKVATKIDDPYTNVAQGMANIGQQWATSPTPYLVPMARSMGSTAAIPGVGSITNPEPGSLALFTNPRGVYNNYTGTYFKPEGRTWNGTYWDESKKSIARKKASATTTTQQSKEGKTPGEKTKARHARDDTSDDEAFGALRPKRLKAAVKTAGTQERPEYVQTSNGETTQDGFVDTGLALGSESDKMVEKLVMEMNADAVLRDTARAKISVTTARPAMAAVKYTCSETVNVRCDDQQLHNRDEVGTAGEGATCSAISMIGTVADLSGGESGRIDGGPSKQPLRNNRSMWRTSEYSDNAWVNMRCENSRNGAINFVKTNMVNAWWVTSEGYM
ncbi:hypothetical protein PHMEG_00014863 [Phytophthora megakarya]|uniref:Retrotransposon gag domain-containing protein n=1 Tax=Phytophthora megakarya TaxID=4795 RepID=A0A225W382_9STRA|nr:hypothetical protein PHMEG_00014863 [Phytophthora megakarya]